MSTRALAIAALVGVSLLTGCSMPVGDDPVPRFGQPEAGDDEYERPDDLPFDVEEAFERTEALLSVEGERPAVAVENFDDEIEEDIESRTDDSFLHVLNLTDVDVDTENTRGGVQDETTVAVDPNDGSARMIELVLVHEFVHALQFQQGTPTLETAETTDERHALAALLEGGAVWATDRYVDAHHDDGDRTYLSDQVAADYDEGRPGDRLFRAPYYFGMAYVDRTVEDPDDFWAAHADPPSTTSEVIHGDRDAGRPGDLSITVEGGTETWIERPTGPGGEPGDRLGEMLLRVPLETELSSSTAAEAAEGWANDELRSFRGSAGPGYVWTIAFESADDADEFVDAFDRALAERTDEYAEGIEVVAVDERTVAVVAGTDEFRDDVEVHGADRDVVIRVDAAGA